MSRRSTLSRWTLTFLMLSALLFGALGGQSLTRVDAAPQAQACWGSSIVEWTFTGDTVSPSFGSGVISGIGIAPPTFSSSAVIPPAVSYNNWINPPAPINLGEYVEFKVDTTGRTSINLTFTASRSGSGPDEFELRYSIDGGASFLAFPFPINTARAVTETELNYIYDLSSVTAINDVLDLRLGIFAYGATGSTGTLRLDNISITGTCITPGPSPTSTATATASPIRSVIITEVAWMGTIASTSHEWIELYNPPGGIGTVDLSNWKLTTADGSPSITIPAGKTIPDGGYFLLSNGNAFSPDVVLPVTSLYQYSSASLFSDSGETVFLRDASNSFIDAANGDGGGWPAGTLTTALNHGTMERMENAGTVAEADGLWITNMEPLTWINHDIAGNIIHGTPGRDNWGYGIINTPTPTRTITPTATNTFTVTPSPTHTVSPTYVAAKTVIITEVGWMGTAASSEDEWIELFNASNAPVDLTGWQIRSFRSGSADQSFAVIPIGTPSTCIPDCIIAPGEFFLLERFRDDAVSDIPADMIYPKTITFAGTSRSSLLSNSGELLLLCTPNNISAGTCRPSQDNLFITVGDIVNLETFINRTPSASNPWPGGSASTLGSMERKSLISNEDTNWFTHTGASPRWGEDANGNSIKGTPKHSNWAYTVTATPRATNTPTRTPTKVPQPAPVLVLNEFVARPGHDWNNDGQVNTLDEFVEVINAGQVDVNLSQYKLDDYEEDANGVEIKNGFSLPSKTLKPGEIAVFYASETGFFLSDAGDTVRLVKASNYTIVDSITYPAVKSLDMSYCRYTDGYGSWLNRCFPTPGLPNSLTGGTLPPEPGGSTSAICLLPDNAPLEFVLAECEQSGLDIWNPAYWDSFPGEGEEFWLYQLWYKWLEIFQ